MRQSEFIKFRASAAEKAKLDAAAQRRGTTRSALLRRAAAQLSAGLPVVRPVAADFATVRRAANAVLAAMPEDDTPLPPGSIMQIRQTMADLKAIAERHLDCLP